MNFKNILFLFTLSFTLILEAQHTISGSLSPAEDFKWLIAYKLNPDNQNYIADTAVGNGTFLLKIPANATTGMYRLVYAVPQEEFYFDVIYNGKEDVVLSFDTHNGLSFNSSKENLLYSNYFNEIHGLEQQIVQFYSERNKNRTVIQDLFKKLGIVQKSYETQSKGMISEHFISANIPYIPTGFEEVEIYVQHKKEHYFDALNFEDPVLQGSGFLTDKAINYVLTALPHQQLSVDEKEAIMIKNVKELARVLENVSSTNKVQLFNSIWTQASSNDHNDLADDIYGNYLKSLATETNNTDILKTIETHARLRLGAKAPEITWHEGNTLKKLTDLTGAIKYVIVFWSSTCSHCLQQLPELHKRTKDLSAVKVLAIGLEDDDETWQKESAKLPAFIHGIALGKWESPYTTLYDIHQTPTYYILDREKRIVNKPENYEEVMKFLKEGK